MHELFDNLSLDLLFLFVFVLLRLVFLFLIFFCVIPFIDSFQLKELSVRRFKLKVLHAISEVTIFHGFITLWINLVILFCDNAIFNARRIILFTTLFIATAWILLWLRRRTIWARWRLFAATYPLTTKIFIRLFKIFRLRNDCDLFFGGRRGMAWLTFISFLRFFLNCMSFFKERLFGKSSNRDNLRRRY